MEENLDDMQEQFLDDEKNVIIRSLVSGYFAAYYIDIDKQIYREITSNNRSRQRFGTNGSHDNAIEQFCEHIVVPEHYEKMHAFININNWEEVFADKPFVSEKYLSRFGSWCEARFILAKRDEQGKVTHVIFYTHTVNDEVIKEQQRKKQEKERMEIITALSKNYSSVYMVDFDEELMIPLRLSETIAREYGDVLKTSPKYTDGIRLYVNNTVYEKDKEYMLKAVAKENLKAVLKDRDNWTYDFRADRGGNINYFRMKVARLTDEPEVHRVVMGFADVNSVKKRDLEKYAYVDSITGGDNYIRFKERLAAKEKSGHIVVMNIRSFRVINSVCGAECGDAVIKEIWNNISRTIDIYDLAAHLNADIFVIYFQGDDDEEVERKLNELSERVKAISEELGTPQTIPYFGVTHWQVGNVIEEVYSKASAAIKYSHDNKNKPVAYFNQKDNDRIIEEEAMENAFKEALDSEEFEVWLQPKYNPGSDSIIGAEALTRWKNKEGNYVFPNKFIPLFEKDGLIKELDEYVFKKVCAWQAERLKSGKRIFPISVNISRASMYFNDVVERYKKIICQYGVGPNYIPLEITESAAIENDQVRELAENFYNAGFPLHMDDFGSGYSSLASLNAMNFDTLKLDKSLIDYIGNYGGERLISHTISLAKELGMHVVAEGVESGNQVDFLKKLGCDGIQGYFYSKALRSDEFLKLLD